MYLGVSTKETIKRDLEQMFSFDADFCGDNGPDYLCDEAEEAGFENNAAYFANESYNKHKETMDLNKMISQMAKYFKKKEGHYWTLDLETTPFKDYLIVALSAIPRNQD